MITRKHILFLGVILIFPLFFISGPSYHSARSFKELWNLGHVLIFSIFAILIYSDVLPGQLSSLKKFCLCLVIVGLTGWGIELAQLGVDNRSVGWDDFFRDLAGAVIVLFWKFGSWEFRVIQRISFRAIVVIIAFICVFPLGCVLMDEYRARQNFPVLSDFESPLELGRWENAEILRQVSGPIRHGKYSAEIQLNTAEYSGISLFYFPENWRGKRALAFSVYNPGPPLELNFRVHDRLHAGERQKYQDRYNGSCVLAGGWNDIVIPMDIIRKAPAGREMDLAHIRGFGLFVMQQAKNRQLYLDDVRLLE